MRFIPFGSGSIIPDVVLSASLAEYSLTAERGLRAITASFTISGSKGERGADGADQTTVGPYPIFPPP